MDEADGSPEAVEAAMRWFCQGTSDGWLGPLPGGGHSVKTSKLQASACTCDRDIQKYTFKRETFFFEFLFLKHVIIISMTLDPRVTQVADVSLFRVTPLGAPKSSEPRHE